MLVACGDSNGGSTNGSTGQCDSLLLNAVNANIKNTENLRIKWAKPKYHSCGVSFKKDAIDYQVNLELKNIGTANDKKEISSTGVIMTNYEFDETVVSFYKDKENIPNLGTRAIYYNRGGNFEIMVLSGDNAFIVKTINWNTRGGDKSITIKVAKAIDSHFNSQ